MNAMHTTRRQFLQSVGIGAAALTLSKSVAAAERKPNIIYILVDDLGYGDLGCYGQQRIQTPNLDKMAAEGMRFTQHYAGSTVCAPSRCVLMTGLHTGHARVRGNARVPLLPEDVTLPELLKGAGYRTGLVGKWGIGENGTTGMPRKQGFDFFYGYLNQTHAHNYYTDFLWRNETQVPLKNIVKRPMKKKLGGVSTNKLEYSHDLMAQEALDFIKREKRHPFFLYLALTIPHANNEARDKGMEVPSLAPYENEDWPEAQKGHAAMITRMDRDIGRLFGQLKSLGLDDNTIVMFTSDNGPHREGGNDPEFNKSSGPLRGIKRDFYEGGIRVPMMVRWPGKVAPGSETDHISAFWDVLPTCTEIVDVKAPKGLDGLSFLPALLGKKQPAHKYLYWEFYEQHGKQGVRMGDWKGIRLNVSRDRNAPIELYNLKDDLGEKNNVAPEHPDIVAKIVQIMDEAHTPSKDFRFKRRRKR